MTAVDVSWRALVAVRINARLNGVRVRARRGRLFAAVPGERFDLIAANPPYLPASGGLPSRGARRHTDAGPDGRLVLDELIDAAPAHLRPGGTLILTHSSVNGEAATVERMRRAGLSPAVLERRRGPLGPLLSARWAEMEARGLIAPGQREEDVLIVAGSG